MASARYYAPCGLGLEDLLADEVRTLGGAIDAVERGGVTFHGDRQLGYAVCLWSRVATRVQEELVRGRGRTPDDLYALARQVGWADLVRADGTLAVFASVRGDDLRHSRFAALRVKDAVVDAMRRDTGRRPSVDTEDPDLPLKVVARDGEAVLYRDLAGDSLHRRGWRPEQVKSPLNEALAAGLLLLTGWDRTSALCDPMCGSGTLVIEAAHLAADRAPGLRRPFAFERWPDLDASAWTALRLDAEARWKAGRRKLPVLLANDRHAGALRIAREAAARAEVADAIRWSNVDIAGYAPEPVPAVVVVNPPYGKRIGEGSDLRHSWEALGRFLKDRCPGAEAWVLSGSPELTTDLRLKTSRRIPVRNGPLDCRWLRYDIR